MVNSLPSSFAVVRNEFGNSCEGELGGEIKKEYLSIVGLPNDYQVNDGLRFLSRRKRATTA